MKIFRFLTICMVAAILSGCACFNTVTATNTRTTTVGQELMDLQKAKDAGVITEDEYNRGKEKLIKMLDNPVSLNMSGQKECKKECK